MYKNFSLVKWNSKDWKLFSFGLLTAIISSSSAAFLILVVKYATDNIQKSNVSDHEILINGLSILFMIAMGILSIIFAFISKIFLAKLSAKKIKEIRNSIFDISQDLSPSDLQKYSDNSIMTRLTLDVFNYSMYQNWLLINVIASAIRWLIFSIIVIIINWLIFLFILFLGIILLIVSVVFSRNATFYYNESISNIDKINNIIDENIIGARVVRSFNLFDRQIKRFIIVNEKICNYSISAEKKTFLSFPFSIAFINASAVLVIVLAQFINFSNIKILGQTITFADILSIFSYAYLILWSIYDVTFLYIFRTRCSVSKKRIYEILSLKTKNINYEGKIIEHGDIEFKNVSFKYFEESKDWVLENISFKIPKNSSFGILGETGSGKTTLLYLIANLWNISKGEILINKNNIKEINTENLLDHISIAFQDRNILFSGTIEENIKFANPNITNEELENVIKMSQLEEFVNSNKERLNYHIEEFGQNLSGGQRQRVNIARSLAKKADIYLFDDTTSALDNLTEQKIVSALKNNLKDSTIIMSSQKISSIQHMDQILVLDKGKISGIGKHEELIKTNKLYKEIYDLQFKRGDK